MIGPGVFPAAVTPFDERGHISPEDVAKLLAHFEAAGCAGVVLAGTNGEGPSLSAVEKRDLLQIARTTAGKLQLILGIATPSLDEAIWLAKRATEFGADGILLMPPYYFRSVSSAAIESWFEKVLDASGVPVLIYNFPKATGIPISAELLGHLENHAQCIGAKDSSGEADNLGAFRLSLSDGKRLFVGDETLLYQALQSGWSGTISGVANAISRWLCGITNDFNAGDLESAQAKFQIALPAIKLLRSHSQPALNKAILARLGIISRADVRLPLDSFDPVQTDAVMGELSEHLGPLPTG